MLSSEEIQEIKWVLYEQGFHFESIEDGRVWALGFGPGCHDCWFEISFEEDLIVLWEV